LNFLADPPPSRETGPQSEVTETVELVELQAHELTQPKTWREVSLAHVRAYEKHRHKAVADPYTELRALYALLAELPERHSMNGDALTFLGRRRRRRTPEGVGGFADDALRSLVAAALVDVRAIIARVREGRELLAAWRNGDDVSDADARLAAALHEMDKDGAVHAPAGEKDSLRNKLDVARRLCLTYSDLTPLMVLMVSASGRNSESIKELPIEHRVRSDGLVAVLVVKRRRSQTEQANLDLWQVGTGSRALLRTGSLYQAVLDLTELTRRHSGSDRLFTVWTNPHRKSARSRKGGGSHYAWETGLDAAPLELKEWVARHGLTEDGEPLNLTFNRVRTSVEVRRTRSLGGHLPSAARSNSQEVLYESYLRPDPHIQEWKDDVLSEAFEDAEALITHGSLTWLGEADADTTASVGPRLSADASEQTGYLGCINILRSPFDKDGACTQTALVCFRCPNAVFSETNLPALLHLKDELVQRHEQLSTDDWGRAYGGTWKIVTEKILPSFSPAQLAVAKTSAQDTVPLRFLEERWIEQ
jgi:hypothetical protein